MARATTEAEILQLDKPRANQPIDYYQEYLQHLDPMISLFEIRIGWLRWLQGTALEEAISSKKVKHGQYGGLLTLLSMSRTTAYNCRMIARQIPAVNARRLGYSEMLRICGLLNDNQVEEFEDYDDDDQEYDLTLLDGEEFDEGERPLPNITYHNFLPRLENISITLEAISQMSYGVESREEAVQRYLDAQQQIQQIKRHCTKVEKLLTKRIGTNKKKRSRTA